MNTKSVSIYHNPRCSKSREALRLLRTQGFEPNIIEYLKDHPSREVLNKLVELLGIEINELVRKNESAFKDMQLPNKKLDHEEWLNLLHANPNLLQRPIVVINNRAIIGRPPERVLELLK